MKKRKYKPTKFKAKDSVYNQQYADYAVNFIECLCHTNDTADGFGKEYVNQIKGAIGNDISAPKNRR